MTIGLNFKTDYTYILDGHKIYQYCTVSKNLDVPFKNKKISI